MSDKIKISQQELDDIYEVEQELTQPKIEDNIDKPLQEEYTDKNMYMTEEELEVDKLIIELTPKEDTNNENE